VARLLACARLGGLPRELLRGSVQVWVSGSSCLSCMGAFRQFQLLFPGLSLHISCQRDRAWRDALRRFRDRRPPLDAAED